MMVASGPLPYAALPHAADLPRQQQANGREFRSIDRRGSSGSHLPSTAAFT
jgi:hypothetical protein